MLGKLRLGKISVHIIALFVLIFPFIVNVNISDMVLSVRYFMLSVLALSLSILKPKEHFKLTLFKNPIIISICILLLINIFSSIYHVITPDAIFVISRIFTLLILIILFTGLFINNNYFLISKSVVLFCLSSLLIYYYQIFIGINNNIGIIYLFEKTSATMGNKNLLASILLLSLPFIFHVYRTAKDWWKVLVCILLILIFCTLLLIQSKAVFLGLLCMSIPLIFVAIKSSFRLVILGFVVSSMIASILFLATPQMFKHLKVEVDQVIRKKERIENNQITENDSRYSLYINTFKMIKDSPFLGVGPGNWSKDFPKYGLKNTIGQKGDRFAQRPHSDFLWFFAEGGILSGFCYLFFFFFLLRASFRLFLNTKGNKRYFFIVIFSTILGYAVISLFDYPSERPSHNFFLSIISAIIISESLKKKVYSSKNNIFLILVIILLLIANISLTIIRYKGDLYVSSVHHFL